MWKLLTSFVSKDKTTANRREMASLASVGAAALCYWFFHLLVLLLAIHNSLRLLVVSNACGVLICSTAFFYNRKGYPDLSIALLNVNVAIYCVLNLLLLGWQANTQWFLLAAILPCQIIFPLSTLLRRVHTIFLSATLVFCFWLKYVTVPYYTNFNTDILVLINLMATLICSLVIMRFSAIDSRETAGYYEQKITHLSNDVYIDSLTGLWNRRYAMEQLGSMVKKPSARFCIAMLDVDFFKRINDSYGHPYGDVVLQRLSDMILHRFRSNDIAVRWGGEEFLIILPDADSIQLQPKLEEFREAVQRMQVTEQGITTSITVTIGVSEYQNHLHFNEVIQQSDVALYYGKNNGRNQVVKYTDIPEGYLSALNSCTPEPCTPL